MEPQSGPVYSVVQFSRARCGALDSSGFLSSLGYSIARYSPVCASLQRISVQSSRVESSRAESSRVESSRVGQSSARYSPV
eukprot:6207004-Lingulodinium_polyedra.AAC.1